MPGKGVIVLFCLKQCNLSIEFVSSVKVKFIATRGGQFDINTFDFAGLNFHKKPFLVKNSLTS